MTNAEKIASDINILTDLIYRADDISPNICKADFNDADELVNCPYPDDNGCMKCIRNWLMKEVEE